MLTDSTGRHDRALCGKLLVLAGFALILFGPNQSKLFGAAYLAIFIGFYALIPFAEAIAAHPRLTKTLDLTRWKTIQSPWPARLAMLLLAVAGLAVAVAFWLWREKFPDLIVYFYVLVGLSLAGGSLLSPYVRRVSLWLPSKVANALDIGAGAALCAVPVIALCAIVYLYGTNAPFYDESDVTLAYITNFATMSWDERLAELTNFHFGHRLALSRLMCLIQFRLNGTLNFYRLMLIDTAYLIAGAIAIFVALRRRDRRLLLFAPFLLLFFNPQYHQVVLWAFGSQYLASFCFAAATLLFISSGTTLGFWLGFLCTVAGAYSLASGLFAGLAALAVLIDQKRYRHAVYWLVLISMLEMRYFMGLDFYNKDMLTYITANYPHQSISDKALYVLHFLGSASTLGVFSDFFAFHEPTNPLSRFSAAKTLACGTGGVLIGLFVYVTLRRYWRVNPTAYGLLAITFMSAVLAADQRGHVPFGAFLSRYANNSALFAALLYLAISQLHPNASRKLLPFSIVASALFCVFSYVATVPFAYKHQQDLKFGTLLGANGVYQHSLPLPVFLPSLHYYQALADASRAGAYHVPAAEFAREFVARPLDADFAWAPVENLPWTILYIGENEASYTFFVGPQDSNLKSAAQLGIVLVAGNGVGVAFELAPLTEFTGHVLMLQRSAPKGATHYAVVPKSALKDPSARVALAARDGNSAVIMATQHSVPTVRKLERVLAPPPSPELFHATSVCNDMVHDDDEGCWFDRSAFARPLSLPEEFTVSLLALPQKDGRANDLELWRLDFNDDRAVRLALDRQWFTLRVKMGGAWQDVTRVQATFGVPNRVVVSASKGKLTLIAVDYGDATQNSPPRLGSENAESLPDSPATLHMSDGINFDGKTKVKSYELTVSQGATDISAILNR